MGLTQYSLVYSGGYYLGGVPPPRTFAALGVTAAKIVSVAGGDDYADITVDATVTETGMPFLPLGRHDLIDGTGARRFTGWLTGPARTASAAKQQQTFRLQGPNYLLGNIVYKQPWNYAVDPTAYGSALGTKMIARVLLNRQDYSSNTRVDAAQQIKAILEYAYEQGAPFTYGALTAIPECQPPEDEQTDMYCQTLVQRLLRWTPSVTAWWSYAGGNPELNFSANNVTDNLELLPGGGIVIVQGGGAVTIDLKSGKIAGFKSDARYDLLLGKVHIDYQSEQEVTDDGSATGNRKIWATLATDESTADNGSPRELVLSIDLRGAGGPRDPETGLPRTPQEQTPVGLAAALHAPYKQLSHSLTWSTVGQDVDWATTIGKAVSVQNAGDENLAGSRSIIQQITRDLGTGTTEYQSGPPTQLGSQDLIALTRFNRTRNAGRGSGSGGSYSSDGGPDQQDTGQKQPPASGAATGGGGNLLWWYVTVAGQSAVAQFASTTPVYVVPPGVTLQNPP